MKKAPIRPSGGFGAFSFRVEIAPDRMVHSAGIGVVPRSVDQIIRIVFPNEPDDRFRRPRIETNGVDDPSFRSRESPVAAHHRILAHMERQHREQIPEARLQQLCLLIRCSNPTQHRYSDSACS
jgi:hypothetical protein